MNGPNENGKKYTSRFVRPINGKLFRQPEIIQSQPDGRIEPAERLARRVVPDVWMQAGIRFSRFGQVGTIRWASGLVGGEFGLQRKRQAGKNRRECGARLRIEPGQLFGRKRHFPGARAPGVAEPARSPASPGPPTTASPAHGSGRKYLFRPGRSFTAASSWTPSHRSSTWRSGPECRVCRSR